MSVTESKLIAANWSRQGADRYVATYKVETDNSQDGPKTVLDGARLSSPDPVPAAGASYSAGNDTEGTSYATNFAVRLMEDASDHRKWHVIVTYTPITGGTGTRYPLTQGQISDPLLRPTEWSLVDQTTTQQMDKFPFDGGVPGNQGRPILNAVGEAFVPPLEVTRKRPGLVARKNVASLKAIYDQQVAYVDFKNSAIWNITPIEGDPPAGGTPLAVPAETAYCTSITAQGIFYEQGISYYQGVYQFVFDVTGDKWDELVPQSGFKVRPAGGQPAKEAVGLLGQPVRTPVNLKDDGTEATDPADVGELKIQVRGTVDFNTLGL